MENKNIRGSVVVNEALPSAKNENSPTNQGALEIKNDYDIGNL